MEFHSAGFYRHLQKEVLLFTFRKRNPEIVDGDATTMMRQKSSPFLRGNSVADFLSRYIIITVGTLRKSPSSS